MKRRLYILAVILSITVCSSGCGKKEEPSLGELDVVQNVVNFSAYTETEVPTEPPTELPSEQVTEPPIEPPTEPITESETEPAEYAYSEDFDFSDETVMAAVYSVNTLNELSRGGGFSDVVSESVEKRVRTVSMANGAVVVTMTADHLSGATNGTVEVSADSNYVSAVKEALLALEAGIHEDNIDSFVLGGYNGTERAPYIGLADSSCSMSDGKVSIMLKKTNQTEGNIPGLSNTAGPTKFVLADSIFTEQISQDGEDPFLRLLGSLDGDSYNTISRNVQSATKHFDRDGNLIREDGLFSGRYESGGKSFDFSTSQENGTVYLTITYTQAEEISDYELIVRAEHIYQYFYHGNFDTRATLDTHLNAAHATLSRSGNGYVMKIG